MSITAFPVLARILEERGLPARLWADRDHVRRCGRRHGVEPARDRRGDLGPAAPAARWRRSPDGRIRARDALRRRADAPRVCSRRRRRGDEPSKTAVAAVLVVLLASALTTELIGIHALFGAFLAGVDHAEDSRFRRYLRLGWRASARFSCCRSSSPSPDCARRSGCSTMRRAGSICLADHPRRRRPASSAGR